LMNVGLLRLAHTGPGLSDLAEGSLPWVWRAMIVLLATGILLTITEHARELMNGAFRLKMLLVECLIPVTQLVQSPLRREAGRLESLPLRRVLAVAGLLLCIAIGVAGRLIADV